ncbi:MAG: hypothetical protein E7Z69_08465 [Thermoplasmata archaeon]|jgi:hypothetical protein|nr:hypothetical protein [Thermoplasmata archaeon]
MKKSKTFISFDYDHDLDIKETLVGQSKLADSPFDIVDMSIKEAIDSNWKQYARKRIRQCDVVIILCGRNTDSARGVTAELTIAREEGIPYFLLAGHGTDSRRPHGCLATDNMYKWTWDNLKILINGGRRSDSQSLGLSPIHLIRRMMT